MKMVNLLLAVGASVALATFGRASNVHAAAAKTETVTYQTTYQGQRYDKKALVYLPAGYSRHRRYNVVYLLHGSTESARDFYRDGHFKRLLGQLNASGQLKDSIVVFPTYYPSRRFVTSNYYRDNRLNRAFAQHELVNDLVPAVEGKYSTYARGTSPAALRNSRDHRAFGGFSMGSITTWYVFEYQLPYFNTFLPMAGDSWTIQDDGGANASRQTARRLAAVVRKYPQMPFKILAGVGSNDGTASSMTPQIHAMWATAAFNRQNLQYYTETGGTHSPQTIAQIFRHYAPQLFN